MGKKEGGDSSDAGREIVTMTQESLDGLFAARAQRAAAQREKEILEELGFETLKAAAAGLDELRGKVSTANEEHEGRVSELTTQLEEAQTSLATLQGRIRTEALRARIAESFGEFGFVEGAKDDVYAHFEGEELPEGVTIDEETMEVTGVKEALKDLAETKPHWTVSQQALTRTPGRKVQTPPTSRQEEVETYRIRM